METRERILAAAEQVIRERGFARATTKQIARAAGCAEGSLYNHFKNKQELFLCILRERLPDFIRQLIAFPARAGKGEVRDNLRELASAALTFYRHAIPLGASILTDPDLLERQRQTLREKHAGPHKANQLLAAYLLAEQRAGRLHANADTETAAAALLGACFQRAYMAEVLGEEPSNTVPEEFIANLLDTVMTGLSPAGSSR